MATRRKAPKQIAPQTIEEATELLGRYSGFLTKVEQLRADADAAIAAIEAARDQAIAPIEEEAKGFFLQLRAWWGVAGDTLTEGKRRSTDLAGCLIGVRTTPPSLKLSGITAKELIEELDLKGWDWLLRTKVTLDKPAILSEIRKETPDGLVLIRLGAKAQQKDEFFIDRAAAKPETPEVVEVDQAA